MINVWIYILTVTFLVGIILFQNFWHQKRDDKIVNAHYKETQGYIQIILDNAMQNSMSTNLFETLQNAKVVYEEDLAQYQDEIK